MLFLFLMLVTIKMVKTSYGTSVENDINNPSAKNIKNQMDPSYSDNYGDGEYYDDYHNSDSYDTTFKIKYSPATATKEALLESKTIPSILESKKTTASLKHSKLQTEKISNLEKYSTLWSNSIANDGYDTEFLQNVDDLGLNDGIKEGVIELNLNNEKIFNSMNNKKMNLVGDGNPAIPPSKSVNSARKSTKPVNSGKKLTKSKNSGKKSTKSKNSASLPPKMGNSAIKKPQDTKKSTIKPTNIKNSATVPPETENSTTSNEDIPSNSSMTPNNSTRFNKTPDPEVWWCSSSMKVLVRILFIALVLVVFISLPFCCIR